jgi:hypothetical protein
MDLPKALQTTPIIPKRITQPEIVEQSQTRLTLPLQFVSKFTPGSKAPSVLNVEKITAGGTTVSLTNFTNGQPGQTINVLGDGVTTIAHYTGTTGPGIYTSTGADTLLLSKRVYTFTLYPAPSGNGFVWVQH